MGSKYDRLLWAPIETQSGRPETIVWRTAIDGERLPKDTEQHRDRWLGI